MLVPRVDYHFEDKGFKQQLSFSLKHLTHWMELQFSLLREQKTFRNGIPGVFQWGREARTKVAKVICPAVSRGNNRICC